MMFKQLCWCLCAPDKIFSPILLSSTFWDNKFLFWSALWLLDRFSWKQLKVLEKQLCRCLWAPDKIFNPTLLSSTFWDIKFLFSSALSLLDRFIWKQLKVFEKQLCRCSLSFKTSQELLAFIVFKVIFQTCIKTFFSFPYNRQFRHTSCDVNLLR